MSRFSSPYRSVLRKFTWTAKLVESPGSRLSVSDPDARHVAALREPHRGLEPEAREVVVGERGPALELERIVDLVGPARVHADERAFGNAPVAPLEPPEVVDRDDGVGIALRSRRDVDYDDRDEQFGGGDLRCQPAALDEVAGCVHVRARMLAERPLLRVEAAARDRDQILPRRRVEREDGEALREDVRFFGG